MEKMIKPDIEGEMDEFQRLSQDLRRDEKIDISVEELVRAFDGLKEQTLTDDVWPKLENTESNEIEKGDIEAVNDIARMYNKTNPKKLMRSIESGDYKRPLILKMGDRYILIAGNTRLCTAAAMGVNPKVFIGEIGEEVDVKDLINKAHKDITRTKGKEYAPDHNEIQKWIDDKSEVSESEELKGGVSDNKTLIQLAKKHDAKGYYHIDNMVQSLKKELKMGIKIELEHTDDEDKAKEIAMDHLWENPSYYSRLKKSEIEEAKKEINEKCWKGYTQKGMKTMFGKRYPNCVKKETNEASSPAQQAAIAINMKKRGIEPKEEVTGNKEIDKNLDNNEQDMVYGIVDIIKKIKNKDNRLSVANDMIKKFKEEDIKFDYNEFLNMCGCNEKSETKEQTTASSSGSVEGPVFSDVVLKRDIRKFHNSNLKEQQEEMGEATDASSSGGYDVPLFGSTPKGRKNPLKISGPDSIYKGRAVKDKNFPKWGGPGGVFVKVKEKCKKFPYCNQGNTGALEFIKEDEELKQAITETSKKYGIPYNEMEKIVLNEISKIFI